ncbi:MAG TPA: ABC transporter permease [Candidatus Acidoferrum sp.]|nr:ABC transporter permease [Candidatus Acidoferrum sp.]
MSKLPFELLLALRYLRPKRTFVSIITLISIIGVALGVAVLIIVISVMSGFDHDLREKILGFNPHLTITQVDPATQAGTTMADYPAVVRLVSSNLNVLTASPFVAGPVLLETQGDTNRPELQDAPLLRGIDSADAVTARTLKKDLVGSLDLSGHGILVGIDFADHLSLRVGDHLSVFSAVEIKKIQDALKHKTDYAALPDDYEVRGIFNSGYYDYDARVVITSIDNAQDLFSLEDSVHGLFVTLRDPYAAPVVAGELQKTLGNGFSIDTWMRDNSSMLTAVAVEKNVMFYLLFFIVLVAALCILSAQITFVIQKTREIGMLKALGASPWQISGIFLFQSSLIGVIGVTCGFGLGMLAVTYRNGFLHFLRNATGLEIFPASVYGFDELPALITPSDVAVICVTSFVICIFGGLLPAWRAGGLKPVEALRYE